MKNKVVIIGCGNVGLSYAYCLLNQKTNVLDLVLIDVNKEKTLGEAMDLNHGLSFAPSKLNIRVGDYSDVTDAKIVVIAAGASQKKGETRTDLIRENSKIFKNIISEINKNNFKGIILIATNPVDAMSYLTWKYSNFDYRKVIGTGTSLDTARLRYMIGETVSVNPKNVHAYVIGEHGDSEFVLWSNANIGLQNIRDFLSKSQMKTIENNVRNAAYDIINKKGNTCYGIGMCLTRITNAILNNENSIITVSTYDNTNDVYLSIPCIINEDGIKEKLFVTLNENETYKLQKSINVIKETIRIIE